MHAHYGRVVPTGTLPAKKAKKAMKVPLMRRQT
jgi:hypothetical protein